MFLNLSEIRELHVEITNICNAACPMCDRNIFGYGSKPNQGLSDWSVEDIHRVFDKTQLPKLDFVYFCGTHGDPLSSKNVFEAIKAAKDMGAGVEIFTNGSLKSDDWWHRLVNILDHKDRITFSVDGIETNHLYRQNTDINKIMRHMKICCDSSAMVRWDFLAFKHNEHEYEKCQQLAKEMGVTDFRLRRTARFDYFKTKFPVLNDKKELTHFLEPPTREELRHPNLKTMGDMVSKMFPDFKDTGITSDNVIKLFPPMRTKHDNVDKPLPATNYKIECIYQEVKKIYVNSRMDVFPCCYISDEYESFKALAKGQLPYPQGELNLRTKTWEEIMNHRFFAKDLEESWVGQNVIPRCIRTCGLVKREAEQNVNVEI